MSSLSWLSFLLLFTEVAPAVELQNSAGSPGSSIRPPTGWVELKAIEPNVLLWARPESLEKIKQGSLLSIQVHPQSDAKVQVLRTDFAKPEGQRPKQFGSFLVVRSETFAIADRACVEIQLFNKAKLERMFQTWCFAPGDKGQTVAIVEKGVDRVGFAVKAQLIESLLHNLGRSK